MKRYFLLIVIGLVKVMMSEPLAMTEEPDKNMAACKEWDKRVDASLGVAGIKPDKLPSDKELLVAIGCLLKHHGDKAPARFSGATNPKTSQILPNATIELASLYYISYLFTGDWQHGDGVALWNREGVVNPPGSVDAAYAGYASWFERVRSLGIPEARKQRLDPLRGTGLHWYGK
jgi:hypothetical protein